MDQVLAQIEQLGQLGYREVVLTGIHIGCYGQDLTPAAGLHELLCRIREAGAIDRVRLSSIEPAELSHEIIAMASAAEAAPGRLCPHFHIPLQSGDDALLKRMGRPYDRNRFRTLVYAILDRLPHASIGVDVLIGFPGESAQAFERTHDLIRELPIAYLHVFPFSARKGTPAFTFANQMPPPVIKKRCARMRRLGLEKRNAFYRRHIGRRVTVLVEASRRRNATGLKGMTDTYVPVHFHAADDLINTFQQVEVQHLASSGVLTGTVLAPR
jgi:threonylcarbamoyladenosine tRNA methylthiotransferase MtaB